MTAPVRIQLSRAKGWRMPENTVKVDRTTKWGNPFVVGRDGTGAECVELFRRDLSEFGFYAPVPAVGRPVIVSLSTIRSELAGRNLACWCKPGDACHADVLLNLANVPYAVPFQ